MKKTIFAFFAVTTLSLFVALSLLTISGSAVFAQNADYAPAGSPSPTTCTSLTSNLGWGTTSAGVTTLQNYLSLTGYMSVEATGYYGNITSNAVSSYQTAHSIEGTGYVGPLTRTAIRNESCGTTANAGTTGTTIAAGSVVCPAGMTCTRATPAATPAVCPLGYVCQPQTGTASTVPTYVPGSLYSPGSAYTPGSLANSASGNQNAGLPAGSMTAAQYQALLQTQGQAASTTTPNAAANVGAGAVANVSSSGSIDSGRVSTGVADPWVQAPGHETNADGSLVPGSVVNTHYGNMYGVASNAGGKLVPRCGTNQYWDEYGSGGAGCYNMQVTSPAFNTLIPSTTLPPQMINDPYCPSVRVNYHGVFSDRNNYACAMGEASKTANYVNPFMSIINITGVATSPIIFTGSTPVTIKPTNLCQTAITLAEAKQLDATGATSTKYFTTSRLVVLRPITMDELEYSLRYTDTNHQIYYWDGSKGSKIEGSPADSIYIPYNVSDWNNPEFQALVKGIQFEWRPSYTNVAICKDANYKSNFPLWASHFNAAMAHAKAQGLWPTQ